MLFSAGLLLVVLWVFGLAAFDWGTPVHTVLLFGLTLLVLALRARGAAVDREPAQHGAQH